METTMELPKRANILGLGVSVINLEQATATIREWIIRR